MPGALTIDVGNSTAAWVLWEAGVPGVRGRIAHAELRGGGPPEVFVDAWRGSARVGIASVERESVSALLLQPRPEGEPPRTFLSAADLEVPIAPEVTRHERIGVDRLLNTLGWTTQAPGGPAVLVDFGTAITIDAVDAAGRFAGGVILPGATLLSASLVQGTARLPKVEPSPDPRDPAVGHETRSAIARGVGGLLRGGVAHHIGRIRAWVGQGEGRQPAPVVATGGDAEQWAQYLPEIERVEPLLTHLGLLAALEATS
ncbi:MAG: type III pantothenate kinase [Planctomycetota bacterium]